MKFLPTWVNAGLLLREGSIIDASLIDA
ncbi:transposase, partial [Candidatus Endoriftia persephone str. Guaymas]|nr:transposase [Candidatus Endoriftia persephone str. Guaymas]